MSKLIRSVTTAAVGVGLLAECEKIALHGAIRSELNGVWEWPFIYTSDVPLAVASGYAGGLLLKKLAWPQFKQGLANTRFENKVSRMGAAICAVAAFGLTTGMPVEFGMKAELTNSCQSLTSAQERIVTCRPDPIDATMIAVGAGLGMASVVSQRRQPRHRA